jgi:HemY protein
MRLARLLGFRRRRAQPGEWRSQVADRLNAGDHPGALAVTDRALAGRHLTPAAAERARVAIRTAQAAASGPVTDRTADLVAAAARSRADFTPAAVLAARLLMLRGDGARAALILRAAWRARPHPALWLAWRDLRTDETPPERAERLAELVAHNPKARESRILAVEAALIARDLAAAQAAEALLAGESLTRRLADLHARVALALGDGEAARRWQTRGETADAEPDWSDLSLDGRPFDYGPADWSALTLAYAESGDLIHPRHTRGEPAFGALPRAPAGYAESAPFVARAAWSAALEMGGGPGAQIEDDGFGEALQPSGDGREDRGSLGAARKSR